MGNRLNDSETIVVVDVVEAAEETERDMVKRTRMDNDVHITTTVQLEKGGEKIMLNYWSGLASMSCCWTNRIVLLGRSFYRNSSSLI